MKMTREGYRGRILDDELKIYLEAFGAVCVEGPKGCGKTWFSLNAAESSFMIADPSGNFNNRRIAELDVDFAFRGESPHLVDEWQEVPAIWDAVKSKVDESVEKGRFILTGSSTPIKKGVIHTGAGRVGILRLRTMSLYESGDSDGSVSLKDLFRQEIAPKMNGDVELDHLIYLTVRGGWPMNLGLSEKAAEIAVRGYVERLIEDASTMDGTVRVRSKMERTLKSLARNESTMAKVSVLVSDAQEGENDGSKEFNTERSVSENSVREYVNIFDRLFLIEDQFAFEPNLKSSVRVGKLPKRHLTDPSLSIAALRMTAEQLKSNLSMFGFYFEALCERDLGIYAQADGGRLFHYRDHNGREIDAIVELDDGAWGAFEIKLGVDEIDGAAENLLDIVESWKAKGLENMPSFLCVICGMSNASYRRKDGVFVVPITSLRN